MSLSLTDATSQTRWDDFLARQHYRPFLQSWTMGEVYRALGQEPVRLQVEENGTIKGICLAIVIPARRGRHLSVPYGPVVSDASAIPLLLEGLTRLAHEYRCSFIRISPHWEKSSAPQLPGTRPSPLHLLAEEIWYLPLKTPDTWQTAGPSSPRTEEELMAAMRKTTRNLVRRAERDGVEVTASTEPEKDLEHFLRLHDETRKRHKFTPYSNAFFRAQVAHFAPRNELTVYIARYQGEVLATSIHMHAFGETSYHHGASSNTHPKVPGSYLLQWRSIQDAIKRGDDVYNFWGIAPRIAGPDGEMTIAKKDHPFAGVTLFKTGFGGTLLPLTHCIDLPVSWKYFVTRAFEYARKWKRGF